MSLLTPADLGGRRLPNRVVVAPATRARVPSGVPGELQAAYYAQRAGAGLVVTEGTWVSERAVGFPGVPGIHTEAQVAGWRRVTDVVHALGGRIVLQLWHTGAVSHASFLGERPGGPSAVDPRESVHTAGGRRPAVTPREMSVAEIRATVADYGTAAENARRAGFDGRSRHKLLLDVVAAVRESGLAVGVRLSPW
jgi:N-ethylmaleimide reductase